MTVVPLLVEGAWADLGAGRRDAHDRAVVAAAPRLSDCGCIVLAQFSMAPLAAEIGADTGLPVLTSPHAAVAEMKRRHPDHFSAVDIENRGHTPMLDEPAALAAVDRFYAEFGQ